MVWIVCPSLDGKCGYPPAPSDVVAGRLNEFDALKFSLKQ